MMMIYRLSLPKTLLVSYQNNFSIEATANKLKRAQSFDKNGHSMVE